MENIKIRIYYVNNIMRVKLPIIDCVYQNASDILDSLYEHISCNGYTIEYGHFALNNSSSTHIDSTNILDYVTNGTLQLAFINIHPINNAKVYDNYKGIVLFFHTSEKCHLFSPHIHATYADYTIKIDLNSFNIIGKFKNRKKQKEALTYVINNRKNLLSEWNRIISQHN